MNISTNQNPFLGNGSPLWIITSILLGVCITITSCSSIINGTRQEIIISANPADAKIAVDSVFYGTGLTHVNLDRASSHHVEITKEGYRTARITTGNNTAGWYWGNLISWGFLGMFVDVLTGAAYAISPDAIVVQLVPGDGPPVVEKHYLDGYVQAILPLGLFIGLEVWAITGFGNF